MTASFHRPRRKIFLVSFQRCIWSRLLCWLAVAFDSSCHERSRFVKPVSSWIVPSTSSPIHCRRQQTPSGTPRAIVVAFAGHHDQHLVEADAHELFHIQTNVRLDRHSNRDWRNRSANTKIGTRTLSRATLLQQSVRMLRTTTTLTTIGTWSLLIVDDSGDPDHRWLQRPVADAFEGGIGGLGKTKPETGVVFTGSYPPIQNEKTGNIVAEILIANQPYLIQFTSPWPLLSTTSGLEARDVRQPESSFVQVVTTVPPPDLANKLSLQQFLLQTVFAQQGKFSAYAAPTDVKVKKIFAAAASMEKNSSSVPTTTVMVTFTTFTPGLRESERQVLIRVIKIPAINNIHDRSASSAGTGGATVLLISGTTRQRFNQFADIFEQICQSLTVVPAPVSYLRSYQRREI